MRIFHAHGTSADLTVAMRINKPGLYAAFGGKAALFRRALDKYAEGPTAYLRDALTLPTARQVAVHMLREPRP